MNGIKTPKEIIESYQKSRVSLVTQFSDIATSQAGTESESSKDYVGRIVFEFFQNAVDRAEKNIWIEFTDNELIISNDGKMFSIYDVENNDGESKKSDFHALNSIHNSNKSAGESIGNKGVGFKSCWNVSDHVIVESKDVDGKPWGFELFNPVSDDKFINKEIKQAIKLAGKKVPSFYFPKYYESEVDHFNNAAVTKITIKFRDQRKKEINKEIDTELKEFIQAKFFFLNQLKNNQELMIHINGDSFSSQDKTWTIVDLKSIDEFKMDVKALMDARKQENYENIPDCPNIAIAFPPADLEQVESKFYTYLPTSIECGFNVLIHADFALDNARISIPNNTYNNKILEIAAKMLINELLTNETLHTYPNFAKFLIPNRDERSNAKFNEYVWNELTNQHRPLVEMLKKVYKKDKHFPQESYELAFALINSWIDRREPGAGKDRYFKDINDKVIRYFCNKDINIVYIDEKNKTFLPPSKTDMNFTNSLFYQPLDESKSIQLQFDLLDEIDTIKMSNFEYIGEDKYIRNAIVRKFSTLAILTVLKDIDTSHNNNILTFISQLLKGTKDNLSTEVQKQLRSIKLPVVGGDYIEAQYCYINIDEDIKELFSVEFHEVDMEKIDIEDKAIFLETLGVFNRTLPHSKNLPFKQNCTFPKSNLLKELVNQSVNIINEDCIEKLKHLKWFYDEQKNKLFSPNSTFLFNSNDNRKVNCIGQEKKDRKYHEMYIKLSLDEIDDTDNEEKLINQLQVMKENGIDDEHHKDIYKKITSQLSKLDKEITTTIPILAINIVNNEIVYVEDKYVKDNKVIFMETKYKQYKEQMKEMYEYLGYFDNNISHEFLENIGVNVFNPNYEIEYLDSNKNIVDHPMIDYALKADLQKSFLPQFLALANERLGSSFTKEDAIHRWEYLTIKKAENVILRIREKSELIKVEKTEEQDVDVLYIPIKNKKNNINKIGQVAHDLIEPMQNSNLRKFARVFAEGIFSNLILVSDFELYISGYINNDEDLKKDILLNNGVEESQIQQMRSFISLNTLSHDEQIELVEYINTQCAVNITYSRFKDFENYKNCDVKFKDFIDQCPNDKLSIVINNFIDEYKTFQKQEVLILIREKEEQLNVLCFMRNDANDREYFEKKRKEIEGRTYDKFSAVNKMNIYKEFDVTEETETNKFIKAKLDYLYETEDIKDDVLNIDNSLDKGLSGQPNPKLGDAKQSQKKSKEDEEKNEKRGLGKELKIAYDLSLKLEKYSLRDRFVEMIEKCVYANEEFGAEVKGKIDRYLTEVMSKYREYDDLEFAQKVIQIASNKLDGLGYDLLVPKIDEQKVEIERILKVELKTTTRQNDIEVHLSKNELERIVYFIDKHIDDKHKDDKSIGDWQIWLNSENNNITDIVKDEVLELRKQSSSFYSKDYILRLGTK